MTAVINIWNMALANIGQTAVNNVSEISRPANVCRTFYNDSRDFVLQDFDWGFAERRAELALVDYAPVGYEYAYATPSDWLKSRRIWKETEDADPVQFIENSNDDLNGVLIFTDKVEPKLIYTTRIELPNMFSAAFVVALSWKLAADIAFTLTKNMTVQASAFAYYTNYIDRAKQTEAESNNEVVKTTSPFLKARR